MKERGDQDKTSAAPAVENGGSGESSRGAGGATLPERLSQLKESEGLGAAGHADSPLGAERRLVTIVFADIAGFTALSETMDPEAVRDIMNSCFDRLVPVINKYGGTVDKFIGDEIMALFGAPVAHENDAELAVLAALEMKAALSSYNEERDLSLGLHFGINTGLVIAGGIGASGKQDYSVMGDAVNVAKRLEDVSGVGEILLGPETYRFTSHLFRIEPLKPVQVKGRREPVRAFRVMEGKSKGREGRVLRRGISSKLVGRDSEFGRLKACLERVLHGQGGIVSIIGEAGLGKSRLAAEARVYAMKTSASPGLIWLEGRTLSFGQTAAYWPFQEILRAYAGITEEDTEAAAWEKLGARITGLFGDKSPEILPYLASLLSLEVRAEYAERVKYLDGDAMRRQVFLAARKLFGRLAEQQPMVLVFEDLHWVDESSVLLLEHLFPLVNNLPLLVCGISRPDPGTPAVRLREIAAGRYADSYSEIVLSPLSREFARELIGNILENVHLVSPALETMFQKAEGNPFFMEEIAQSLVDQGVISRDSKSGRWHVSTQLENVTIPDTVHGLVMARLDRLDEDLKHVLRIASVIGRSFLYRILRSVSEKGDQLDMELHELQELELIREKQRMPELEYIFKHALTQEAAYESIMVRKRRELHRRIGDVIETLFGDRLEEFYALLAYHYAKAEAWEKAQEYLFKAGDTAARVAADAEAIAHYRRAVSAYVQAFGDKWNPLQRASLERKMGEALFRRGQNREAIECLQLSLAYLGQPWPSSRTRMKISLACAIIRQAAHRLRPRAFLRPLQKSTHAEIEETVRVYEIISWIEAFGDSYSFLFSALSALNVSERANYAYGIARGLAGVGIVGNLFAMRRLAAAYLRLSLTAALGSENPSAIGLSRLGSALSMNCLGRWEAALDYCDRAEKIYHEIGELRSWGYAAYMKACALSRLGELSQALLVTEKIVKNGRDGADSQIICWGLRTQGHVLTRLGRFREATAALLEAIELSELSQDHVFYITACHEQGVCHLKQGDLEQALRLLEKARKHFTEHPTQAMVLIPFLNGLPEAYIAAADTSAGDQRALWLSKAASACKPALKHGKRYPGVMPEAMRLKGTCEWLRGRQSKAAKWWKRSLSLAEALKQQYDVAMTLFEMGRRTKQPDPLERAESLFQEMGAESDAARARSAKSCL